MKTKTRIWFKAITAYAAVWGLKVCGGTEEAGCISDCVIQFCYFPSCTLGPVSVIHFGTEATNVLNRTWGDLCLNSAEEQQEVHGRTHKAYFPVEVSCCAVMLR
jgi:hypothetical protein